MIKQRELQAFYAAQQRKAEISVLLRQQEKEHAKLEVELLARVAAGETVERGRLQLRRKTIRRWRVDWRGVVAKLKGEPYAAKLEARTPPTEYPHLQVERSEAGLV